MNVHPLLVHFPIVLLLVALLFDAVGTFTGRDWLLKAGHLLLALGAIAAISAAVTGNIAARAARKIPDIRTDLHWHENLGTAVAWLSVALLLARTHLVVKKRFSGPWRLAYLAAALAVALLVSAAGYTGGRLVYRFGAGTRPVLKTIHR